MVLEKSLESPLDFKEIQPLHSKGDQTWVFFGRNNAKAETPVLWPPHVKSWLIGKNFDAGRDWGQEEKGTTEDEMTEWHYQLLKFTQTHVRRVGDAIQPSHPLSSPSPPAPIPPSIRVFSSESTLSMRWPKYWSFSFSIIPSKEHPGLISFRMDWLDLLAVQGTLKNQLFGTQLSSQHNSHIHTRPLEKP